MAFENIDINSFCSLQGIGASDKFVLNKKYNGQKKSYDQWYDLVKNEFAVGDKKTFKQRTPAPAVVKEVVKEEVKESGEEAEETVEENDNDAKSSNKPKRRR